MFEHLKKYNRILVTGPQRSGTRICAVMIAHDTGHHYCDERIIYHDSLDRFAHLIYGEEYLEMPMVVQCPGMSRWVHKLPRLDKIAVVWMDRPIKEIIASQERIEWPNEWVEQVKYPELIGDERAEKLAISQVKWWYWVTKQKSRIPNCIIVPFSSLAAHPLWIPADERAEFRSNQVIQDGEVINIKVVIEEYEQK